MDELNTVDAVQEPVVEAQTTAANDGETAAATEVEQPQESAKPAQSAEENAQYAKIRREAEQRVREESQARIDDAYRSMYAGQSNPYTGQPIQSEADFKEFERQHKLAQLAGDKVTAEDLKSIVMESPEYQEQAQKAQELQEIVNQHNFEQDLAKIKAHNPKEAVKTIDELGMTFIQCRSIGLDTITSYEIARAEKQRLNPTQPSMGDLNNTSAAQSEFFTFEEVAAMSQSEVSKNWNKIQKSRPKW